MPTRTLAVAVAASALALAGCGGEDRLSLEEFKTQANEVCADGEKLAAGVAADVREQGGTDAEEAAAKILEQSREKYHPVLGRLKALKPPEDVQDRWDDFVAKIQEAFDLFPRVAEAIRAEDRAELQELTTRFAEIAGPTRRFAQDYDLQRCMPDDAPAG
jgi:hypothetical protein